MTNGLLASLSGHLPSRVPTLSTDFVILLALGLVVLYSLVVGHAALVREAISLYVGLVLAATFGSQAYAKIAGGDGHFPLSQTEVKVLILILPVVLLQFGHHKVAHKHHYSFVVTLILALLTGLLAISSVMSQLDAGALQTTLNNSTWASWIYDFRYAWLAGVPIGIAASALFGGKSRSHH
jgi:hypothetical protein